jgi:hypothetical protein
MLTVPVLPVCAKLAAFTELLSVVIPVEPLLVIAILPSGPVPTPVAAPTAPVNVTGASFVTTVKL